MQLPQVRLVCDGSSLGNGREEAAAAAAALLTYVGAKGATRKLVVEYLGPATNQQAEIVAACIGLEALTRPCQVEVVTDSRYVVETMTGGFRRKANHAFWERLDRAAAPHHVTWTWTPGHAGHPEQEACDQAARRTAECRGCDEAFLARLLARLAGHTPQTAA
ncbi:MAG: ribonuclease HI [Chloracidobacterium sp.]|nr:ribonuclease HI [Chloracidobacterium sp.]MDW8218466.1 RNase H family protein [Acidobacteriota bacterium]